MKAYMEYSGGAWHAWMWNGEERVTFSFRTDHKAEMVNWLWTRKYFNVVQVA